MAKPVGGERTMRRYVKSWLMIDDVAGHILAHAYVLRPKATVNLLIWLAPLLESSFVKVERMSVSPSFKIPLICPRAKPRTLSKLGKL
jgi:hypothetical protein